MPSSNQLQIAVRLRSWNSPSPIPALCRMKPKFLLKLLSPPSDENPSTSICPWPGACSGCSHTRRRNEDIGIAYENLPNCSMASNRDRRGPILRSRYTCRAGPDCATPHIGVHSCVQDTVGFAKGVWCGTIVGNAIDADCPAWFLGHIKGDVGPMASSFLWYGGQGKGMMIAHDRDSVIASTAAVQWRRRGRSEDNPVAWNRLGCGWFLPPVGCKYYLFVSECAY